MRSISPVLKARVAGVFYLLIFATAPFHEIFVRGRLIDYQSAAATAANIMTHESLYRLGLAVSIVTLTCDVIVALILLELLAPVSHSLSVWAAAFRLTFVAIMAANALNYFAPLVVLGKASYLTAFNAAQLQALALASQRMYNAGFNVADVFFGVHVLLLGYLIFRSGFLPRGLGGLLVLGGVCYLTVSFANLLVPENGLGAMLLLGAVGELALMFWLLIKGVNEARWSSLAAGNPVLL